MLVVTNFKDDREE